jgi:hypothetical protein
MDGSYGGGEIASLGGLKGSLGVRGDDILPDDI